MTRSVWAAMLRTSACNLSADAWRTLSVWEIFLIPKTFVEYESAALLYASEHIVHPPPHAGDCVWISFKIGTCTCVLISTGRYNNNHDFFVFWTFNVFPLSRGSDVVSCLYQSPIECREMLTMRYLIQPLFLLNLLRFCHFLVKKASDIQYTSTTNRASLPQQHEK